MKKKRLMLTIRFSIKQPPIHPGLKAGLTFQIKRQMKNQEFKAGDKVKYIGRGFLRFSKDQPFGVFESYEGNFDAFIIYNGTKLLVYRSEIEKAK